MQFACLAQSPREMALTDRILPRYFLSRVCVSIRPRFFYTPKNPRPNQPAARSHASAPPTIRTAQFETQIIPSRQVATYVRGLATMDDFVGAHAKPPQSKKKLSALQRSSQARQRMRSIREEATAPGANTPLTLQVPSDPSYWAQIVSDNRPIDWANGERVGDPGKLSRHGRFPGHAGSYSDNVIYHEVM